MKAIQPKGLCLEQVTGFERHRHFDFIQHCFEDAGYQRVLHDTVELGDFLPTFRPRYLAVWMRQDLATEVPQGTLDPFPVCPTFCWGPDASLLCHLPC